MNMNPIPAQPAHKTYAVIIIGGAMMGSAVAWFLASNPDFCGRILVVERDPSYQWASTSHTNSCIRQQFSTEINIRISQFAIDYIKNFAEYMASAQQVPSIPLHSFGYMYLASTSAAADQLRRNQSLQAACGVATRTMSAAEISARYPFYNLDDIILGSHNAIDEGYWDSNTVFQYWRNQARIRGVEYLHNRVVGIQHSNGHVDSVTLASGENISAAYVVNASGPRAAQTAAMAGLHLPVEPRKRFTFVFDAQTPLDSDLPLTIDPSGVHVRSDGRFYMCGCAPDNDHAVDPEDFSMDESIWEQKVWPALAYRIPSFAAIKLRNTWVGHYAFNRFDQNAVIGPHPELENFIFINGFSGHGLQQSPAMGRGVAELIVYSAFRSLDLSALGYERIVNNRTIIEQAII